MILYMKEFEKHHEHPAEYIKDPDENWHLRPDVAGYEYPEDGANWRIGIVRDVIDSPARINAVSAILNTPFTESLTRNMARVVIREDLLRNPSEELKKLFPDLEVLISLKDSGNDALKDCYQAIFSRNAANRQTTPEVIEQELTEANRVFHQGQEKSKNGIQIALPEGIQIQRLSPKSNRKLIKSLASFVSSAFADEDNEIEDLVEDEDAIVLAATTMQDKKPIIVGSVYASMDADTLRRNGKNIRLSTYEISGAKVRPDMENRGIYKALSTKILEELAQQDDVDFVFGYSNAENLPVLAVAGQMGRTIVTDTASELGLPIRPAMKQTITDGKLVDEIVTYIPGNTLRAKYSVSK